MTTKTESPLYTIRDFTKNDFDFIMATWLKSLRYGNEWFGLISAAVYFSFYQKVIERILSYPKTVVKIACLTDDPEVILGYSIYTGDILHWVFIKKAWRKIGIATSLMPEKVSSVTHLTIIGKSIINKKRWNFNPFLIN